MNYIYNIQENILNDYYNNLYNSFFLNNNNEHILIINQNYYNPLTNFSNYLKKHNTNLYILFNDTNNNSKLIDEIKDDECKKYIHCVNDLKSLILDFSDIQFSKIILIHLENTDFLNKIINITDYFKSSLYLYISLTTKNKIFYKNQLRKIMKISSEKIGKVFDYDEIFTFLNSYNNFNINSIQLINNNHLVTYGSNKKYLFILKHKYT